MFKQYADGVGQARGANAHARGFQPGNGPGVLDKAAFERSRSSFSLSVMESLVMRALKRHGDGTG